MNQYRNKHLVFHCLAYGRAYRNNFTDYLLDSILNSLHYAELYPNYLQVTLLISADPESVSVIRNHPNLLRLQKNCEVIFLSIENSLLKSTNLWRSAMIMSDAHNQALKYAIENNCILSYLSPDTVVSTKYVSRILDFISKSDSVALLAPAVRLTYLDNLAEYFGNNYNKSKELIYNETNLVQISLNNLHNEANGFFFNSNEFLNYQGHRYPTTVFFESKTNQGIAGFGMSWFMMAIDVNRLKENNLCNASKRLSFETIDAGFLNDLLTNYENIDFVLDSCESFIVSWDQGSRGALPEKISQENEIDLKLLWIRWGMLSGVYDYFKLKNFKKPFFWHSIECQKGLSLTNFAIPNDFISQFIHSDVSKFTKFQITKLIFLNRKMRQMRSLELPRKRYSLFNFLFLKFSRVIQKINNLMRLMLLKLVNAKKILRNILTFNKVMDNGFNLPSGRLIQSLVRIYLIIKKPF